MRFQIAALGLIVAVIGTLPVQAQVFVSEPTNINNDWSTFAVLTGGETVQDLDGAPGQNFGWTAAHKKWDGLGAFRSDSDTLQVYINHEVSNGGISRLKLDVPSMQDWIDNRVVGNNNTNQNARPANLIEGLGNGWTSVGSGDGTMNRPCSGNVWEANTFGAGRGFADRLYLSGEETFGSSPTGHFQVIDTATNTLYEAADVGGSGSWEGATIIDTGRTDTVAILMGEDRGTNATGTAPLSLYVGQKNASGDFLQRNGLSGGTTYYWDADGGSSTDGTLDGPLFMANNDSVTGTWTTNAADAVLFSKAEDVHTNMQSTSTGFGVQAALASQDQAVFLVGFENLDFVAGDLGANRQSVLSVLFEAGTDMGDGGAGTGLLGGMDNLVWSADGSIYINEDDGEGDIWQIDTEALLADYALGDLTPNANTVFQILDADSISGIGVSESSGIIDISRMVGYTDGSIFLTNGMGSTSDQLAMLVSPTAMAIPEPTTWGIIFLGSLVSLSRRRR